MACQFRLTTQNAPPRLRSLASLAGPRADKFPFELGKTAQYGQHETAVRCRRVSPSISKRFEAGSLFGDLAQQVEEIAGRPAQTIKPSDDQHVALCQDAH